MADDLMLGILTGEVQFNLPQKEVDKLDMSKYQDMADKNPITFAIAAEHNAAAGGAASGGGDSGGYSEDDQRKKNRGFIDQFKNSEMGKGLGGLGKMLGPIGAALAVISASGGLRELLGAFFDLIGLISDLIFVALFPVIKPLLDGLISAVRVFAQNANRPGGILSALFDGNLWAQAALYLAEGLLNAGSALFDIGAQILNGIAKSFTQSDGGVIDSLVQRVFDAFVKLMNSATEFALAFFNALVVALSNNAIQQKFTELLTIAIGVALIVIGQATAALLNIGAGILDGFARALNDDGSNSNILSGLSKGFIAGWDAIRKPLEDTFMAVWSATGRFFHAYVEFVKAMINELRDDIIKVGGWMAEGFKDWIAHQVDFSGQLNNMLGGHGYTGLPIPVTDPLGQGPVG